MGLLYLFYESSFILLKNFVTETVLTFESPDVLYVPPALTDRHSLSCPQSVYVFCVDLRKNSEFFPLHSIKGSIFRIKEECVHCAVRAGSLNQTDTVSSLMVNA